MSTTSERPEQVMPSCNVSVNMVLYLNYYIEWDEEREQYVSCSDPKTRASKLEYIEDMYTSTSAYMKGCREEFEWLYLIEKDHKVRNALKRIIANMT